MTPLNSQYLKESDEQEDLYILFENDFSDGLQGWSGLLNSGRNYYPTLHPASLTGPHSMMVDTRGGVANVEAAASKRMAAFEGVWRIDARFAWNTMDDSGPEQNALDKLRISLDWQRKRERRWYEIQYLHYSEGTSSLFPRWRTTNGNGATVELIDELSDVTALDQNGYELGYNQTGKFDFMDFSLRFRASRTNPKWLSMRLNDVSVDLTGQAIDGEQSVHEEFDNGANLLFYVENRASNSSADPFLLVDYVRVGWER